MKMRSSQTRSISAAFVAGLLVLVCLNSAKADRISASVGIPLSHQFSGKYTDGSTTDASITAGSTSGVFLGVTLPFLMGFGVESYETKIKQTGSTNRSSSTVSTTMFDLLFNLPIPIINVTLGLGTGITKINSTSNELGTDWKTGSPTQFLASVGYNILPLIDLHLSYRMVSSHTITRISSSSTKAGLGGSVTGIGVKIGF